MIVYPDSIPVLPTEPAGVPEGRMLVIGDIQGCLHSFLALLEQMAFDPVRDQLILLGDLVNRGPDSLGVLRWVYAHRAVTKVVLGNHDLHLLALAAGATRARAGDTLAALLAASEAPALLDWLRRQPLVIVQAMPGGLPAVFVHAGLWPGWSLNRALACSAEVQGWLQGEEAASFPGVLGAERLRTLYGNQPLVWRDDLCGIERIRTIVNICTRMRMLTAAGELDFSYKGTPEQAPEGMRPWYTLPDVCAAHVYCGHWSALGLRQLPLAGGGTLYALDGGCVWGRALHGIALPAGQHYQTPARDPAAAGQGEE